MLIHCSAGNSPARPALTQGLGQADVQYLLAKTGLGLCDFSNGLESARSERKEKNLTPKFKYICDVEGEEAFILCLT